MADGTRTIDRPEVEEVDDLLGHATIEGVDTLARIPIADLRTQLGSGTATVKTKEIVLIGGDWQVDDIPPGEPDPENPTYAQRAILQQYLESAAAIGADLGGIDYVIDGGDEVDRASKLTRENQDSNFFHPDLYAYLRMYLGVALALIRRILGNHSRDYDPATESEFGRSFNTALRYTQKVRHFFARGNRMWIMLGQESPVTRGVITDRSWKWWEGLVQRSQHLINITVIHQPLSGMHTGGPDNDVCTEEDTPDEVQTNSARFLTSMARSDTRVDVVFYFHTHHRYADQLQYYVATHGSNTTVHVSAMTGVTTSQESDPQWDLLVTFLEFNQGSDVMIVRRFNARTREPVQTLNITLPFPAEIATHNHADSLYAWDDRTGYIGNSLIVEDNIRRYEVSEGVWAPINDLQDIVRIAQTDKHRDNMGPGAGPGIYFNNGGEYAADPENGVRADAPAGAFGVVRRNDGENNYRGKFIFRLHDIGYAPISLSGDGEGAFGVAKVEGGVVVDILILEPGEGYSTLTGTVLGTYGGSGASFNCVIGDYTNILDGGLVEDAWIGITDLVGGSGYPNIPTDADLKDVFTIEPDRFTLFDVSRTSDDRTKGSMFYKDTKSGRDYAAWYAGPNGTADGGWFAVARSGDSSFPSTARVGSGSFTGLSVGASSTVLSLASGVVVRSGSGSPEGVVTASPASLYLRTDDGSWYRKATGTGNTGWTT